MPNNDDCVFGIPSIQCPSCLQLFDLSGPKAEKFSKQQRQDMFGPNQQAVGVRFNQDDRTISDLSLSATAGSFAL